MRTRRRRDAARSRPGCRGRLIGARPRRKGPRMRAIAPDAGPATRQGACPPTALLACLDEEALSLAVVELDEGGVTVPRLAVRTARDVAKARVLEPLAREIEGERRAHRAV